MVVDRAEVILRTENITTRKGIWADATVDTNDTVTFGDIGTITNAYCCLKSDSSTVTFTKATNVLTITQAALTAALIEIFVVGTVP